MANFLGKVFEKKFGPADKKYDRSYLSLKEGYLSIYRKWGFDNGMASVAFKQTGDKCNVLAGVKDVKLSTEKPTKVLSAPSNSDVNDAADAF